LTPARTGTGSWTRRSDDVAERTRMHPFGPRGEGRMTVESGPGLLSQHRRPCCRLMQRRERARSSLLRCRCCLQLGQDVEGTGQQPPGDRHGGDVAAPAAGQLAVGVGEQWAPLGRLGGLLQDPTHPRRALLGDVAVADLAVRVAHLRGQPSPGAHRLRRQSPPRPAVAGKLPTTGWRPALTRYRRGSRNR
jgi:hypothetical protein